jgi:D-3-phosphoglycerate dehydrogenase
MKILFTAEYDEALKDRITELGDVKITGWAAGAPKMSEDELLAAMPDCEALIITFDDITRKVIDGMSNLKLIFCTRATPVNVDVEYAKKRGIPVLYTPGRNSDSTAEMTVALMLSVARKVPMAYMALKQGLFTSPVEANNAVKDGLNRDVIWGIGEDQPYSVFKGVQLKGRALGVIGYGSIGRRVADICRAFGMKILIYDPYVCDIDVEDAVTKKATLDELFSQSDFVTTHLKVTPETTGMIGKKQFDLMKPTAYYLNTSRAAVVDEAALISALREKKIAGAALDVFASEPIASNHPFITELDNVVITPHICGAAADVLNNHTRMIINEVRRYLKGEPLLYKY